MIEAEWLVSSNLAARRAGHLRKQLHDPAEVVRGEVVFRLLDGQHGERWRLEPLARNPVRLRAALRSGRRPPASPLDVEDRPDQRQVEERLEAVAQPLGAVLVALRAPDRIPLRSGPAIPRTVG